MLTSNPACTKPSEEAESFKALRKLSQSSVPGLEEKSSCFAAVSPPHVEKRGFFPPIPQLVALRAFPRCYPTCVCILLLLLVFPDRLLDLGPGDFARSDLLGRLPFQLRVFLLQQALQFLLALQLLQPPLLPLLLEGRKDQVMSTLPPSIPSTAEGSKQPLQEQGTPLEREQAPHFCS